MTESTLDDALRKDVEYLRGKARQDGPKVPGSQQPRVFADPERLGEIAKNIEEKLSGATVQAYDPKGDMTP